MSLAAAFAFDNPLVLVLFEISERPCASKAVREARIVTAFDFDFDFVFHPNTHAADLQIHETTNSDTLQVCERQRILSLSTPVHLKMIADELISVLLGIYCYFPRVNCRCQTSLQFPFMQPC